MQYWEPHALVLHHAAQRGEAATAWACTCAQLKPAANSRRAGQLRSARQAWSSRLPQQQRPLGRKGCDDVAVRVVHGADGALLVRLRGRRRGGGGGDFKRTRQAARPHPRLHRPQQPQPSLHASRRICSDMHRGSAAPRHPGPTCRMCSSLASPLVLKQYSTPSSPRQYAHSPRGDRQNDRKLPPAALPLKKLEITWGREARGDALSANPSCVGVEALPRGATTPAACRRARAAHLALHRHEVQRAAAVTHKQLVGVHGVRRHRVDGQVLAVGRLRRPAGGPVRRSDGWLLHRSPAGWPP